MGQGSPSLWRVGGRFSFISSEKRQLSSRRVTSNRSIFQLSYRSKADMMKKEKKDGSLRCGNICAQLCARMFLLKQQIEMFKRLLSPV